MTLFDDDRYDWRETYFVYFESVHRPKLADVRRALKTSAPFLEILDIKAEPTGDITAMTIASYEDHAALEIVYREGNDILAEAKHLAYTFKASATPQELLQLKKVFQCRTRLDVHHFEQTAETRAFSITKLPEIKFPKSGEQSATPGAVFSKAIASGRDGVPNMPKSNFQRLHSQVDDAADSLELDSGYERINPEMLVTVLEIFCRVSRGVALDPASGVVLD
ncbi:MAG: hypothetical protein FWG73_03920 [Planctomycetaceae bacterium]|nr:hypothetical protein [Planctomycetaceae bacterium]